MTHRTGANPVPYKTHALTAVLAALLLIPATALAQEAGATPSAPRLDLAGQPRLQRADTGTHADPSRGTPGATQRTRVSETLRLRVARDGSADAIILLRTNRMVSPLRGLRRDAVAQVQEETLRLFAPGELRGLHRFAMVPALTARLTADQLARFEASPHVVSIGANQRGSGGLSNSLTQIGADQAHRVGLVGDGIVVAVLDTGIDTDHPDFSSAIVGEQCFCQGDVLGDGVGCCPNGLEEQSGVGSAEDDHGHGTNVAGIVLARGNNQLAPPGVAPGALVVSVKVLDANNAGWLTDWAKGLDWVLANRPDVQLVNLSLQSGAVYSTDCDTTGATNMAMAAAIDDLSAINGAATISISGNYAQIGATTSPGCLTGAIQVGAVYDQNLGSIDWGNCADATTGQDQVVCFSNVNSNVDLLAPGCPSISARPGDRWSLFCGTSQAAPHVTGVAALLLEREPGLSPAELKARLTGTGVPVLDDRVATEFPRVDAAAAIGDLDDDGSVNAADNCPLTFNPGQGDHDDDLLGDPCDNCPFGFNPEQGDFDQDRVGNACDTDPYTFAPETLFVVDEASGGTIYQLDRGTRSIINAFPTPEPVVGGGSGLGYSSELGILHFTNGTSAGTPTVYELDPLTGAVLDLFPQTEILGGPEIQGLGDGAGGLISAAVFPGAFSNCPSPSVCPVVAVSNYETRGVISGIGFNEANDNIGLRAAAGQDGPLSFDDHSAWWSVSTGSVVPDPAVPVNLLQLVEFSSVIAYEQYLAPTRCVAPGGNGILDTPPEGDDVFVDGEIHVGPNGACDTQTAVSDDLAGCIDAGPNDSVDTAVLGDDLVSGRVILPGPNAACNTLLPSGDDLPGGMRNRPVNGVGSANGLLFASTADVPDDVLYTLDAYAPPLTFPPAGPAVLEVWKNPTPGANVEAIAAGPADTDFDGVINPWDNCIVGVNPIQEDDDIDGAGDVCDCSPQDPDVWAAPNGFSLDLRFGSATELEWLPVGALLGPATVYDVIVGPLSDLHGVPGTEFDGAGCLVDDTPAAGATDPAAPGPGEGWYYLGRLQNDCGVGHYGYQSGEAPRTTSAGCPPFGP